jgi:RNA polymerase sigma factor (TIGR02999 family)
VPGHSTKVTGLLLKWAGGDAAALDRLIPLVHPELQRIARRCMAGEREGHSLQATALVNEVYLRLVDGNAVAWNDRRAAVCARVMRHILVDPRARARARNMAERHASPRQALVVTNEPRQDRRADDALQALAALTNARAGCRAEFFGGLSVEVPRRCSGVSRDTVMRLAAHGVAQNEMRKA